MIGIQNDREWNQFRKEFLDDVIPADDEKFSSNSGRVANMNQLIGLIKKAFERLDYEVVMSKLKKANTAYANLNSMADFENHPQLRLVEADSENGPVLMADRPAKFAGYETGFKPIPALGEHDEQIREEFKP